MKLPNWDEAQKKIFKRLTDAVGMGLEIINEERTKVLKEVIYSKPQLWGYQRTKNLLKNITREVNIEPKTIVGILREDMEYAEPVEIKPPGSGGRAHLIPALERSKDQIRKLFEGLRI